MVNKVDRPAARSDWVVDQTFELFLDLGASDEQCGEPVLGASPLVYTPLAAVQQLRAASCCLAGVLTAAATLYITRLQTSLLCMPLASPALPAIRPTTWLMTWSRCLM